MAFSHREASEVFPENGAGRVVLISDEVVVVEGVWVDMAAGVLVMTGLAAGGTRVVGWTTVGLYAANGVLEGNGVVARSRGLLGFGSGLISSGSRLILVLRWDILTMRGWSYS